MIEVYFRTSDGRDFKDIKEASKHELLKLRCNYEEALAKYHYFRFNNHRQNCRQYLRYKNMHDLDTFIKNTNFKGSRSQARKKYWELRNDYREKVIEGEKSIKVRKRALQQTMTEIRRAEAKMKEIAKKFC
jgi:hypothetical protein